MSWKHLGQRAKVTLYGVLLAILLAVLALVVGSRSMEYQQTEQEHVQETPVIPTDGPTWTMVLEPTPVPGEEPEETLAP